ncbi:MAG: DNA repair protein Rad50, partial [Acidobacteriota bacterium]|nr:DNA repair protein Rad50 [Acidobacteriota bacterium]
VRHSEEFFRNITDGRYQTVFSPLDSSEIQVTDSSGVPKQPSQLSRGTREQLFLSLRFGLIQDLGQRSEPLPVILDEALVNFDPERGLRAARAFVELSRINQVLVFTCHPTIVELFQDAAAQSGVQEPQVVPIG